LPIQYNYILQGLIYNSVRNDIANFLHKEGFRNKNRNFKMFTYSRLMGDYTIDQRNNNIIFEGVINIIVSSPYVEFCNSLISGLLLKDSIELGKTKLRVIQTTIEKEIVECDQICIQTLSPIVVYSTVLKMDGKKYTCYFQPGEPYFNTLIESNLKNKYEAFYKKPAPEGKVTIKALNQPKLSIVKYKRIIIKGYSGEYILTGPKSLLQMALDSGLGSKNSQGFGCIQIKK